MVSGLTRGGLPLEVSLYCKYIGACKLWSLKRGGLSREGSLKRGTTVLCCCCCCYFQGNDRTALCPGTRCRMMYDNAIGTCSSSNNTEVNMSLDAVRQVLAEFDTSGKHYRGYYI